MEDFFDALHLWTTTDPYKGFRCETINWRLAPAFHYGQYRVYRDPSGAVRGFVTWAFMTSEEFESLDYDGWEAFARDRGDILVIVDMVAPYGRSDVFRIGRDIRRVLEALYPDVGRAVAHRGPRTGVFPARPRRIDRD